MDVAFVRNKSRENWDAHWSKTKKSSFGKILEMYRKLIIANSVRYYVGGFFPESGIFLEAGSGTSQTSLKIKKKRRMLIALDISKKALLKSKEVKNMNERINADIFYLPFKNNSIDGIWNLGVMEHFSEDEIQEILGEFHRAMKSGSFMLLFWPPRHGSSHIILNPIEFFLNVLFRKNFHFFPDEISQLKCKKQARSIIEKAGFALVGVYFNHRDLFTNFVVVCRKL